MRIATAQSLIAPDITKNGQEIEALIRAAHAQGADLVHFPEGALSGYAKKQLSPDWSRFAWDQFGEQMLKLRELCAELEIWAVIGGVHRDDAGARPFNSLFVIDPSGQIAGRYDKRFCSHTEITDWYVAGKAPLVVSVKGRKLGFALCIEIQFPEVFMDYERADVDCVLFSAYADKPMFGIQAQAHAACNNYWISFSSPANISAQHTSRLLGPDGTIVATCGTERSDVIVNTIDPNEARWDGPCQKARPWRRLARSGSIYR